ncbi:hypothetical protein [Hafnia alvei]|uniref:hypothetical protein n=1 Tax=Hafnia alvei TaxID=569 RepID=UPI0010351917|nr:hypothetical protein [Hafnia alvei]TBM22389.1 hypothetical protein EYY91_21855 [Hafnia alvei]
MIDSAEFLQGLDREIKIAAKNAMRISVIGDDLNQLVRAFTIDRDLYEPIVTMEIDDKYAGLVDVLKKHDDKEGLIKLHKKVGKPVDKTTAEKMQASIFLLSHGYAEMAQAILDSIYEDELRKKYYPVAVKLLEDTAYNNKMRDTAQKPRNKYHDEIVEVMKLTWERNPCMAKNEMIRNITQHYPGKVDRTSLLRWIKKEGLTPPKPEKYKSGRLVFPDSYERLGR